MDALLDAVHVGLVTISALDGGSPRHRLCLLADADADAGLVHLF